jgi:hypothetical protein
LEEIRPSLPLRLKINVAAGQLVGIGESQALSSRVPKTGAGPVSAVQKNRSVNR